MAIPDYADERSHKFFTLYYVGPSNGEDGTAYKTMIDTRHEDLKPSKNYRGRCCAYCGQMVYAIQPDHMGFEITGYFCVCKDAMDEVELNAAIEELEQKHSEELLQLKKKAPKPSVKVKRRLIEHELKDDYYLDRTMKALGIS